jgi:ubiquinone biosynthesis O-methyltransferase
MKKDNSSLKSIYEKAYKGNKKYSGGKDSFFTFSTDDVTEYVIKNIDFNSKKVLEVGCGTGNTAYAISKCGVSSLTAIDYAEEAIKTCKNTFNEENLEYKCLSIEDVSEKYDVIIMQEVIEHLDEPEESIKSLMENLNENGSLILTCPNFTNLRGYIWMTLQILFDVPMSLSDLHFFSPFDFEEIAKKNNYKLEWSTFAHDRVFGENLIIDMKKRLTNALKDAEMPNDKVGLLMEWLEKVVKIENYITPINGGKGFYVFKRGDL